MQPQKFRLEFGLERENSSIRIVIMLQYNSLQPVTIWLQMSLKKDREVLLHPSFSTGISSDRVPTHTKHCANVAL